jgi:hypothetical protein
MKMNIVPARAQPPACRAISPSGLALMLAALLSAAGVHAQEVSAAEKLLFVSEHMQNVTPPKELRYSFVHREPGKDFRDRVTVAVTAKNADGSVAASAHFLNGDNALTLPAINEAHGNPALLGFLEHDLNEMKRLTGGSTSYFRKRIRMALAESASVEDVSLNYGGRQVKGKKIAIQPYRNDPMREKMPKYEGKNYVFIISDAVPGSLYQLRSSVPETTQPGGKSGGAVLMEETMTLDGAKS